LAEWLNVSQHWLHYGAPPSHGLMAGEESAPYGVATAKASAARHAGKPSADTIALAVKIQSLPPHRRYLIEELIKQLQDEAD
jgi:hypothetical protein